MDLDVVNNLLTLSYALAAAWLDIVTIWVRLIWDWLIRLVADQIWSVDYDLVVILKPQDNRVLHLDFIAFDLKLPVNNWAYITSKTLVQFVFICLHHQVKRFLR